LGDAQNRADMLWLGCFGSDTVAARAAGSYVGLAGPSGDKVVVTQPASARDIDRPRGLHGKAYSWWYRWK